LHNEAARAALSAGAHVIVEKPLALSLTEFDQLAALAAEKHRVLICVHNWKYAPAYAVARRAIEAGRLGAIRFISIDRLRTQPAGAGGSGGKWRAYAASGGGILIDHGWHVFYLMHWLMGGDSPVSISARLESPAAWRLTTLPTCESGSGVERSLGHIFRGARRCAERRRLYMESAPVSRSKAIG